VGNYGQDFSFPPCFAAAELLPMKSDVIIVGGGCAGMVAAIEAREAGARVAIIDKGQIALGTNSALSNATFFGPTRQYSPEKYVKDTLRTGREINREALVRLVAKEAPHAFSLLRSLGLTLGEFQGG